ncbi:MULTISPECIES: MFS transporter [Enterococcus]|uniref:MFS transporter n=1 Tax=Enterococcus TaxID=1350 RepID=UPI00115C52FE|nr:MULTISPECIES: MFS transporter [Enterococcus]MBT0784955.1 MFS transporter [Enterococcus faecalis]MBT2154824.1 MFS transporter [Enterococcus faecalis]MDQ8661380.1 MFS transporter [Enterococcus sp. FR159]
MKKQQSGLTNQVTFLLALTCGVVVANMYYIQPIGTQIAQAFQVSIGSIGFVTMLTQLGYALGLLFLVPLGDVVDRRKLIIRVAALSSLSLSAAFFALSSFFIGLLSIVAQIIIPYAAVMAGPANRGKVTGRMLGGLLTGILLSRTISGFIASAASWRTVYLIAVIFVLALVVLLQLKLPKTVIHTQTSNRLTYLGSLKSLPKLIKSQPLLREATVNGFFMFATFSIFWSTLIFFVSSPAYYWGPKEVGILAIFGLSGAFVAPIIGRLSDYYPERKIVLIGLLMQFGSFILLFLGGTHVVLLILAIIVLDIGTQFGQVANQTRVQNLGEEASNRNNTVFMFFYFIGGSLGSLIGTLMWQNYGWSGVTLTGIGFQLFALFFHFMLFAPKKK